MVVRKMKMRQIILALTLAAMIGCATSPTGPTAKNDYIHFYHHAPQATEVTLVVLVEPPNDLVVTEIGTLKTGKGIWTTALELPPATYRYFFLVDGLPVIGPSTVRLVKDDFGGMNGMMKVVRLQDGSVEIY